MSKAITKPQLTVSVVIQIDEIEARALDALAGYGDDAVIKMFYESCGRCYMEPYEKGLRSFLTTIRGSVSDSLNSIDEAREHLAERVK